MKIIGKNIRELAALCINGEHRQLYLELKAMHPHIEFPCDEEMLDMHDEMSREEALKQARMLCVEHGGINWLIFAKNGRIIDSDFDSL